MDGFTAAVELLPEELSRGMREHPEAEEIRLRNGVLPHVVIAGRELPFYNRPICSHDLAKILEKATGASLHAAAPALCNGFLSYHGLRIGVCGEAIHDHDGLVGFRSFSSLAIRIPHALNGLDQATADKFLAYPGNNTLIIAPPGVGKTSCLRELIRLASGQGTRVAVIDERNEISASEGGAPQFDLGPCADVLVWVEKLSAAMMLLRGMNPQVIAMDEISSPTDIEAVQNITGCGVTLYATAHGKNVEDMKTRPVYQALFRQKVFKRILTISLYNGGRKYLMELVEA